MPDLILPQKSLQKLKPYLGELPSYVQDTDRAAEAAGLSIRRLHVKNSYDNKVILIYIGTREQISRCTLVVDPSSINWDGTRWQHIRLMYVAPVLHKTSSLFRIDDEHYGIQIHQPLPEESGILGDGVEYFKFERGGGWEQHCFIGTARALVAEGIVEAGNCPDEEKDVGARYTNEVQCGHYTVITEETTLLFDGRWLCIKHPNALAEAKGRCASYAKESLDQYETTEQFLESVEDFINAAAGAVLRGSLLAASTKSGMRYTMSERHAAEVLSAIEVTAQRIRNIPVSVMQIDGDPARNTSARTLARDNAASASTDAMFQKFMQQAIARPAAKKKGGDTPNAET